MSEPTKGKYTVQAVDRAIMVLKAFSIEHPELTLGELADRVGLSKPTAFRLLATLAEHELIDQDPETGNKYHLGFGVLSLADLRLRQTDLRTSAAPHLRTLRDEINETVVLAVRVGDDRVHIDQFEATQPVRRVAYIGERVPLHAGAAGKLLLAAMEPQEFEDYLARASLEEMGPNTITSADELRNQVERARELGYATGRGERAEEGSGIAVPIRGRNGNAVAALHVLLPGWRFTNEAQTRILALLKDVSATIGKAIGWNGQTNAF